jgi:hypothetical protein
MLLLTEEGASGKNYHLKLHFLCHININNWELSGILLGVLISAIITALIHSSSAMTAIVLTMAANGTLSL